GHRRGQGRHPRRHPLYQAVRGLHYTQSCRTSPHYVNQLVVLSDGEPDSTSPDTLADLLRTWEKAQDPGDPSIICLGYGAEADMGALAGHRPPRRWARRRVGRRPRCPAVKFALFSL
ncbi:hypothetical protein MM438_13360, partial [Arsenicicoccus dermatophilus]|nr:hypothetical protein [Arsenicicoccus dermatophilus]